MTLRERFAALAAAVRAWGSRRSAQGTCLDCPEEAPPLPNEILHCPDCRRPIPTWYSGNKTSPDQWFCPHCYRVRGKGKTPFPTSDHMDVRQEDLDALQEDWKTLCRDGAASRGEPQNESETP